MNAAQLLSSLPPEQAGELLTSLREADRGVYRAMVASAAARRRLRPAFLERKPLAERHAWMARELGRPGAGQAAAELIQSWLLICRQDMLTAFLDALGVPHDGHGVVESLPSEPPVEALRDAVQGLLARFPRWQVRLYLEMFCAMDIAADWLNLRRLVRETFAEEAAL